MKLGIVGLPNVGKRDRPPRMMHIEYPLGRTFSATAYDVELQATIVKDLLNFALNGGAEEIISYPKEFYPP